MVFGAFVIMPQYYPLQLSGCFGVLPRHLVAEERYSSFYGESYRILYNYGSSDGFAVDRFSAHLTMAIIAEGLTTGYSGPDEMRSDRLTDNC